MNFSVKKFAFQAIVLYHEYAGVFCEEIQAELKQIALERQMLEDTYMPTTDGDMVEV